MFLLKQNGATMNRRTAGRVAQFCLRREKKEKLRNYGTNFTNVNLTAVLIHIIVVTVTLRQYDCLHGPNTQVVGFIQKARVLRMGCIIHRYLQSKCVLNGLCHFGR